MCLGSDTTGTVLSVHTVCGSNCQHFSKIKNTKDFLFKFLSSWKQSFYYFPFKKIDGKVSTTSVSFWNRNYCDFSSSKGLFVTSENTHNFYQGSIFKSTVFPDDIALQVPKCLQCLGSNLILHSVPFQLFLEARGFTRYECSYFLYSCILIIR